MTIDRLLLTSWDRAWKGAGANGDGHSVRDDLLQRYSEPHRSYTPSGRLRAHTIQHLRECIDILSTVSSVAKQPGEIELALWFHDAAYDQDKHNEERSADLAVDALKKANAPDDMIELVRSLILITRHTEVLASIDEMIIVDVDLAILGANEQRFAEYEQQIRQEYSYVPDDQFKVARQAVLNSFLNRKRICSTDLMFDRFGKLARQNLKKALAV